MKLLQRSILTFFFLAWASLSIASVEGRPTGKPQEGGLTYHEKTVMVHLPETEKKHNIGGSDGAGLCVFTSIEYAARYQNVPELKELQKYMSTRPGGGYPEKVDKVLKDVAPGVQYLQDTTGDLSILELALKTGRHPCVTYDGYDVHYSGQIAHMINLVYLDDQFAAVTDNNFPKDSQTVWMTREEFKQRFTGGGGGWSVVLLAPPPPPTPHK